MLQTIYELGEQLSINESLGLSPWRYPDIVSGRASERTRDRQKIPRRR